LARTFVIWARVRTDPSRGERPNRNAQRVLTRVFLDETRRPWWRRERGSRSLTEGDERVAAPVMSDPDDVRAVHTHSRFFLPGFAPQWSCGSGRGTTSTSFGGRS
jgi:hypothetical protein